MRARAWCACRAVPGRPSIHPPAVHVCGVCLHSREKARSTYSPRPFFLSFAGIASQSRLHTTIPIVKVAFPLLFPALRTTLTCYRGQPRPPRNLAQA